MNHISQAQIVSDSGIATRSTRDLVSVSAQVAHLARLAPDVIGVTVELERPLHYFPGQYCNVEFRGFPPRCLSPSYPLEGGPDARLMHFHIQAFPDGVVSAALGETIRTGHQVRLTGPFGKSFLRSNRADGTVLVSAVPDLRRCGASQLRRSRNGRSAS